jgi:glutathione S-transferase
MILHHYDLSPFSEKIRVIFGMKSLAWQACDQPVIMPKPELIALTGGYRRIPVLQIGADIYFDTALIAEELERRVPTPSIMTGIGPAAAAAFSAWADQGLFWQVVTALFGGDLAMDEAFLADRSALLGRPFGPAAMQAAAPAALIALAGYFDLVNQQLSDGRAYLSGDMPGVADACIYHNVAFLRWGRGRGAAVVDQFPHLLAWESRVRAIGHGQRGADISREDAIALARNSVPAPTSGESLRPDLPVGCTCTIAYNDANTPPLTATIVAATHQHITVRPVNATTHLHMPFTTARITAQTAQG